ncbi:RING-box protein hrt1 [Coemansia sp. IMI 203386]|nr:RING-box protein hrt1 [Coemansia sp. IMI 203386]
MADMDVDSSPKTTPAASATTEPAASDKTDSKIARPRIEIKKWNAVAMWAWDMETDICAICRNNNMDLCIECQAQQESTKPEECNLAWGICNHAYHFHCIARWLKNRHTCPLDNREWDYQKFGR